jgi:hypothetical protein
VLLQGCLPTNSKIVSEAKFVRSVSDPSWASTTSGFCRCIPVRPTSPRPDAKALAASLVSRGAFRLTTTSTPQLWPPFPVETRQPLTCPIRNWSDPKSIAVSKRSSGSEISDRSVLISTFCPAKGLIFSINFPTPGLVTLVPLKSSARGPRKSSWFWSASACLVTVSASDFACSDVAFADLASFCALPAAIPAASASSRAVVAEWAASPASNVTACTLASLHSCILASRLVTLIPVTSSPTTPPTINIQPTNATTLTHCGGSCFTNSTADFFNCPIIFRHIGMRSWIISGASRTRPRATNAVAHDPKPNHQSLILTKSAFSHPLSLAAISDGNIEPYSQSDARRDRMIRDLVRFLKIMARKRRSSARLVSHSQRTFWHDPSLAQVGDGV